MKNIIKENQVYRLLSVTDHEGNDRRKVGIHTDFYIERVGCKTKNLRIEKDMGSEKIRFRASFIEDEMGSPLRLSLRSSSIKEVKETDEGVAIYTRNSIYTFIEYEMRDEANLIELYISNEGYNFLKGFYYDENKKPQELVETIHLGNFTDSVLIGFEPDDELCSFANYVCRFFPGFRGISFYNTIYNQQKYETELLIHNIGEANMQVKFDSIGKSFDVGAGNSVRIRLKEIKNNK